MTCTRRIFTAEQTGAQHKRQHLAAIINDNGYACLQWFVEDIAEIRPDLSRAEACLVLAEVVIQHDYINGVSWNTVEGIADDLYPAPEAEVQP